jgi:hypothetical protein
MASNTTTHVIRGKLSWAKVIGEPRLNTFTDEREWSVDVTPDTNGLVELERIGITDKLKKPKKGDPRKDEFISFRQKEFREDRKTGKKVENRPITIKDAQGNDWNGGLLGNDTIADVKFTVSKKVPGRPRGVYIQAIRVLNHVPFEVQEFAPLSEDDEFFASSAKSNKPEAEDDEEQEEVIIDNGDEDLDDDVPF